MKAVKNFVDVVGDKAIDRLTRDDMLDFKAWWFERIKAGEAGFGSANKDLTHLTVILKLVNEQRRLGLDLPLGGPGLQGCRQADPAAPVARMDRRERCSPPARLTG